MSPEPGTSGIEKTAPSGELEFSSRSNQKNIKKLQTFFQFDLGENSSSPEGAVFSRPDVPASAISAREKIAESNRANVHNGRMFTKQFNYQNFHAKMANYSHFTMIS